MNIIIRSYLAGSFLLENCPQTWDTIAILDTKAVPTSFLSTHARSHFYLRFDDVAFNATGKRAPTTDDIRSALEFAAESEDLLVCCRAGQSRSAAVAFVVCFERLGRDAAYALLDATRHIPNTLVVELASRVLGHPELLQTFRKWHLDHTHIRLSDHIDDIEKEWDELERQGARNRMVA